MPFRAIGRLYPNGYGDWFKLCIETKFSRPCLKLNLESHKCRLRILPIELSAVKGPLHYGSTKNVWREATAPDVSERLSDNLRHVVSLKQRWSTDNCLSPTCVCLAAGVHYISHSCRLLAREGSWSPPLPPPPHTLFSFHHPVVLSPLSHLFPCMSMRVTHTLTTLLWLGSAISVSRRPPHDPDTWRSSVIGHVPTCHRVRV